MLEKNQIICIDTCTGFLQQIVTSEKGPFGVLGPTYYSIDIYESIN